MKKLVIGGAIAAVLLVAAVWIGFDLFLVQKVDPAPPVHTVQVVETFTAATNVDRSKLQALLDSVSRSIRKGETGIVADLFELPFHYERALTHDRSPDPALPRLLGNQNVTLYSAILNAFVRGGFGLPWDRVEIDDVLSVSTGDLLVHVRQISGDLVIPVSWRLKPKGDRYTIVDVEDRLIGLSVTQLTSLLLTTGMDERRAVQVPDVISTIRDCRAALLADSPREAEIHFNSVKRTALPEKFKPVVLALEGMVAARNGESERAETIAALLGDKPVADWIRTMSSGGDGWLEKRVNAARKYELKFGPTPMTTSVRIQEMVIREKMNDAKSLVLHGVILFPDSPTLQAWASVLLP